MAAKARMGYGQKKDANHKDVVHAFECGGASVMDLSTLGGGIPDLAVWCGTAWHMVEIKNPKTAYGRRGFNRNQRIFVRESAAVGCEVHIVRSPEEAIELLNEWRKGSEPSAPLIHVVTNESEALAILGARVGA